MEDVDRTSRIPGLSAPAPGPVSSGIPRVAMDALQIRAKWERSQKDLDRERQSRRAESEQTAAKLAELENKLRNTADALEKARTPGIGVRTTAWAIAGSLAILLGLAVLICIAFAREHDAPKASIAPAPRPRVPLTPQHLPQVPLTPQHLPQVPLTPQHLPQGAFSSAASRLSESLASVPGSPEQIFREVNAKSSKDGPVCPIEWSGDEPAVVFGSGRSNLASLDAALNRCADAVERLGTVERSPR